MSARSGHIMLDENVDYQDLYRIYEEIYRTFIEETRQMPEEEEQYIATLHINLMDLKHNRKPEGINRMGDIKLIFPIKADKGIEMCIYSTTKNNSVVDVTNKISDIMKKYNIGHRVEWNRMRVSSRDEK
ncbi:MAG: hypothetical protein DRN20_01155 [Thermoplasmata archaeon]|nr:MAG: hypothetical protein DRN20_01155 [Thermoplasmata archaeon]